MTLKDLAKDLGVSPSTISRVLNGCTKNFTIKDDLRKRILEKVKECGYQPNPVFQAIKKPNTRQVAILFYSRSNLCVGYIMDEMIDRAMRVFDEKEYNIHFTFSRMPRAALKYALPSLKCVGFLIPDCDDPQQLSIIESSGVPYVCMNGVAGPTGTSVISDEKGGMHTILQYLHKLGHRKIAYLCMAPQGAPSPFDIGRIRRNEFKTTALQLGIEPLLVSTMDDDSRPKISNAAFERFDGTPPIRYEQNEFIPCLLQSGVSAVVCNSDFVMDLYYWAGKAEIRIPKDISIIAYNNVPFLQRTLPPTTSFRIPAEEMGTIASQILLRKIQDSPTYRQGETVTLKGELIHRDSVADLR